MTPLLILSDNPLGPSGLGRIGRELAQRIAKMPEIRLGYAALGGTTSRTLPYPLYPFSKITRDREPLELDQIWRDFAGDEKGVILTIWNHTWLSWVGKWKQAHPGVEIWAYVPVDSTQADGKLPMAEVFNSFDRILAYTEFGANAIAKTTGAIPPALPHGLDPSIFYPLDRDECRRSFGIDTSLILVGIVATNHERKDWGLGFETVAILRQRGLKAALWAHTDKEIGDWDIRDLARIHDVPTILTTCHYLDSRMCQLYNSCAITLGIGNGGWELPLSESLACGVPVVTMDWAGQTEFVPASMRIEPIAFQQFGPYSFLRPIHSALEWADRVEQVCRCSESLLPKRFEWDNCWPSWEKWIKEGLER